LHSVKMLVPHNFSKGLCRLLRLLS
jgi:hypothetical protein